jgi:hypothetical protein
MDETRDGWSKAEVIFGAMGALGSIAIPIMLFVVGNRISERQAEDSAAQLQADRVERMLGHLASTNADERRLAVNVVRYFSAKAQAFPEDLIPLLIEVASADPKEDVAATASGALEKLAEGGQGPAAAEAAKIGLRRLPPRLNVRAPREDERVAAASATVAQSDVVVTKQQADSIAELPQETELRYFRKEDQAQAQQLAGKLAQRGIKASVIDLSAKAKKEGQSRPRNFDLVMGKNSR